MVLVDGQLKLAQEVLLHKLPFACFWHQKWHASQTQTDRPTDRISHKDPTLRQLVLK